MIETVLNMVYPAEGDYWRVMTLQEERRGVTIMHNIVQEIGSALSASVEQAGIPTTPQETAFLADVTAACASQEHQSRRYKIDQRGLIKSYSPPLPMATVVPRVLPFAGDSGVCYGGAIAYSSSPYPYYLEYFSPSSESIAILFLLLTDPTIACPIPPLRDFLQDGRSFRLHSGERFTSIGVYAHTYDRSRTTRYGVFLHMGREQITPDQKRKRRFQLPSCQLAPSFQPAGI